MIKLQNIPVDTRGSVEKLWSDTRECNVKSNICTLYSTTKLLMIMEYLQNVWMKQ